MPTTSRYAYILDTLRAGLATETTFDVHKVFTKETFNSTTKTVIYCNIISDDLAQLNAESKYIYDVRTIRCGIYAVALQGLDSNNAGTGAITHGSVVEKIDKVIDDLALTLPNGDTTSAGYTVTLHTIRTAGVTGHVDDKSAKIPLLYEVDINYTMSPVA
jgi:hypothetical protein